jgi:hypothetical protein
LRGPIDYIIVGFEGDKFNGGILKALAEALDKGVIDLVALSFIRKDAKGDVTVFDITDMGDAYAVEFAQKYKTDKGTVDQDDISEMGELLENNTAAGLLVVEHLWAVPLKQAIIDANGVLVAEGRIHPDAAAELK